MGDRCEIDEDNRGSLDCMFDDNRGTAIDLVNVVSDLDACLWCVSTARFLFRYLLRDLLRCKYRNSTLGPIPMVIPMQSHNGN